MDLQIHDVLLPDQHLQRLSPLQGTESRVEDEAETIPQTCGNGLGQPKNGESQRTHGPEQQTVCQHPPTAHKTRTCEAEPHTWQPNPSKEMQGVQCKWQAERNQIPVQRVLCCITQGALLHSVPHRAGLC